MAKKMAAKKVKVVPKPKALWGCVSPAGEIYSWTIRHEKAESIAEYESGSGIVFEESGFSCVKLHVAGFDSVGNPKPKVVPQAWETERLRIEFPESFWRKFWAGCFVACGHFTPEMALRSADDLAKRFREGK